VLRPVVRIDRLIFFAADLTQAFPRFDARVPVEIRPATPEDFETFAPAFERIGVDRPEIRRRTARGDVAIVAVAGGTLTHAQWITFVSPWVSEIGAQLVLGPGEACSYQAYTPPEWRGHGIYPAVGVAIREYERSHGGVRHISWAWASNFESLGPLSKLSRPTRMIWSVWVLGMRRPVALGVTRRESPPLVRPAHPPRTSGGAERKLS
jgi:GNAT superfamily N-acetyltransferase